MHKPQRKIWDCILFGFEFPLLLLHMHTLEHVIDGFLVTESTACFQTAKSKQAILSEALAAGTMPSSLASMTTVLVIAREDGIAAGCKDMVQRTSHLLPLNDSMSIPHGSRIRFSGRCFQSVQRLALLSLLERKAAPDDLAFIADVDEIAAPQLVSLLRTCAPFPPLAMWPRTPEGGELDDSAYAGYMHIAARQLLYGAHCDLGESWKDGPRLYLAGWLLRKFRVDSSPPSLAAKHAWARGKGDGTSSVLASSRWPRALVARRFDALRPMGNGKEGALIARRGGWHLTSWGSASDVYRKLTTFGAAVRFGGDDDALDEGRIEACRRCCVALLGPEPLLKPTPCHLHSSAAMQLNRKALPKALKRYSLHPILPDGRPIGSRALRHVFRHDELPPYLIDHPEAFPHSWLASLRMEAPRWAVRAEPILGLPIGLWYCPSVAQAPGAAAAHGLPAVLLYRLGELGPEMAKHQFEFISDDASVGDVYIVADSTSSAPRLNWGLSARTCAMTRELEWADIGPLGAAGPAGNHYSGKWCMQKLELLTHLPESVTTAVLVDGDAFVLPDGMRLLRDQIAELAPSQFVAAPRSDARVAWRFPNGTSMLAIPRRSEGINSGLLAVHVQRMRAFASNFCRGMPWWRCILKTQPKGYKHVGGDQAIWNALLVERPYVWRPLPCGTHLSIDALRAEVARLASANAVPLCSPRAVASSSGLNFTLKAEDVFSPAFRRTFDSCHPDQPVLAEDQHFGPVPRADLRFPWPSGVAVTHGAARLQPLARLVAALLTARTKLRRKEIFESFPCWCYHYIRSDGGSTFGAPRGTPLGDTGCHAIDYGLAAAVNVEARPDKKELAIVTPPVSAVSDGFESPLPSFSAEHTTACATSVKPSTAAFCFTGHPRTLIHTAAQATITQAIRSFGAHAYTFFVLTDDDGGSSWGHPPIRHHDLGAVQAAMAAFHPKVAQYGPFDPSLASYAADRRKACGMSREGLTRAIGSRPFMRTFFESHHKLRVCYEHVASFEMRHAMRFDWIVRMRPDIWFFGHLPSHCQLSKGGITFPAGVVGCGYAPCINDHIAFTPRRWSSFYFRIADDMRTCPGLKNLSIHWKDYNVWRLLGQSVPLVEPSPVVPYTLLRPCGNPSPSSFYPECHRWAERAGIEKNAGLTHYANGSALPNIHTYRIERRQAYNRCADAASATFPTFTSTGQERDGRVSMARLQRLCAVDRAASGKGRGRQG